MTDSQTDVNVVEGETAPDSSTETKPAEATPDANVETKIHEGYRKLAEKVVPPATEDKKPETVPYARFKDEVTRWKGRALDAEARASAKALVRDEGVKTPESGDEEGKPESRYVTREELDRRDRVDTLVSEAKTVLSKYDGSNGWPKFDLDEATEYMKRTNVSSYETAYWEMHREEILEAEKIKAVEEATKKNIPTTVTKGGQAFGQPAPAGILSKEGIAKMSPEEWKKMGGSKAIRDAVLAGQIQ